MSEQLELAVRGTENQLPRGWETCSLGALSEVVRGSSPRPKGSPKYFGGAIPWIMIADVTRAPGKYLHETRETVTEAGAAKSRHLQAGTLILSNSGTVCVPKILAVDGCIHDGFVAFPDLPASISKLFLYYYFEYLRPWVVRTHRQGMTQVNLNLAIVRDFRMLVPPAGEQRRIVAEIEKQFTRLDAAVANLERVKANLKRARASVLKAAVEGRLVPTEAELARAEGRDYEPASVLLERILAERKRKHEESDSKKKYKPPVEPETDGLPELPEGWTWASMQQLVQGHRPICYGVLKAGPHDPKGVPLVRVTDVASGNLSLDVLKHCDPAREARFARSRLATGDLLVSKDGTIGRTAVVPAFLDGANVTQHVLRVATSHLTSTGFIRRALDAPFSQAWMKGETKGVALQGVNVGDFRLLPIRLPPLKEQVRILAEVERRLSVIDALESTVATNLARCDRLRQSILKRAFEGKLVPQDPTDEPASALLARIQAEAEAATPPKRTKKKASKKKTASSRRTKTSA